MPERSGPLPMGRDRVFALAGAGALLATAVFLAWLALGLGGARVTDGFDDVGELVAALVAALVCGAAAVRAGSTRAGWWLLAAASSAWAAGEAVWTYYDLVDGVQVPFPSLADAGFLAAVPLLCAALVVFPGFPARAVDRLRSLLDGCIVATSVLMASWVVLLQPIYRAHRGTVLAQTIALSYPVSDVLMLSLVLILLSGSGRRRRVRVGLVLAGVVALTVSDSSFAYLTEVRNYSTSLFDTGWVAAFLLIGLGALRELTHPTPRPAAIPKGSTVPVMASYGPVLAVLAATSVQLLRGVHLGRVSWIMAYALGLLVLAREVARLRAARRATSLGAAPAGGDRTASGVAMPVPGPGP